MQPILFGFVGAASVIALALVILFICQIFLFLRRERKKPVLPTVQPKGKESASFSVKVQDRGRVFLFNEVEDVSEGFSNHIGDGTTYFVYKGILADGTEVAVKRMRDNLVNVSGEAAKFHLQIDLLYRVHHQHIINLVGYCDQKPHRMLLCQYAPNGSLYEMLHGDIKDEFLTWKQRLRVAMGVAYGVSYLHNSCNPPIIHGELASVNILLTEDFAAKITGLGKVPLLRSMSDVMPSLRTMNGGGQPLPEPFTSYSRAHDVYSFGVILLELLSGRKPYTEETGKLEDWAMQNYLSSKEEERTGLMDPSLKHVNALEFSAIGEIARLCLQKDSESRPPITEVLEMLLKTFNIGVDVAAPISSPVTLRGLMAAFS